VLAIWVSVLGFLLFSQVRYGTAFTAPGAVVFALVLVELRSGLARRLPGWLASACVAILTAIALFPAINDFHRPSVARAFAEIGAGAVQRQTTAAAKVEVEMRFGERVRQATPETRGFLDSTVRPEYGILVPPTLGHRFAYTARRAVPSNNLGPYLDVEKYRLARNFYRSDSARGALETLEALGVRYVVTVASGRRGARFTHRLHRDHESSIQGRPSSGRLRLVATSGDAPRSTLRDYAARVRHATALKLFEVVSGAVLVVEAEPGSRVTAEIWLRPENGERRLYQTVGLADAEGVARLRVPYATAQQGPVSTSGAWLVRVAGRVLAFQVGEADVHEGREVSAKGEAGEATRAGAVGPA
jgi:hypothetical protein